MIGDFLWLLLILAGYCFIGYIVVFFIYLFTPKDTHDVIDSLSPAILFFYPIVLLVAILGLGMLLVKKLAYKAKSV